MNQNAKDQKIKNTMIWWNMKDFFCFQKNVSVDTTKDSILQRVIHI